ncbi:heme NO-binding domain-containing protein [Alkalicella caledoniensis]|uniref:Heme NO-binding domain-containing protein n=1 Tax=Alkalicella caledoniensis TaxID=2731377 RepID=A0A7G9WCX7_ALKCA|nr:heme NO-binding domain-containing protein [Alkalicella caledoniensis]QNO16539.1 heme NO-binding domain-containing protein [Alkalicella caledoniensis]
MKGTLMSAWMNTARELYGDDIVEKHMNQANWDKGHIIKPSEDIPEEIPLKIIKGIATELGITVSEIWQAIGKRNIMSFFKLYPSFFKQQNLYSFLSSMDDIHTIITNKMPGATPPRLIMKVVSKNEATLQYISKRGMFDYLQGLLYGAADYFKEKIEVSTVSKSEAEGSVTLKLTFEQPIVSRKNYPINKVLSLGFIKSAEVKIAIMATAITSMATLGMSPFVETDIRTYAIIPIFFISSYISSKIINLPLKKIMASLDNITNKNYYETNEIYTKDQYEALNNKLNLYKNLLVKDFVAFKGLTDEMDSFGETFTKISADMNETSSEISLVVEQVAAGAMNQAEETENSVSILNDNINSLKEIVDKENESKDLLEGVVGEINQGYNDVKQTTENLQAIISQFSRLKDNGDKLEVKTKDINEVVETVTSIAEQTNLLALNASIEAARAGEQGRGFSVVAEEIRKLAEESKKAATSITDDLNSFTVSISEIVQDIENQFTILKDESSKLEKVADSNFKSTQSIRSVTDSIIEMIDQLTLETNSISNIYQKIENLAAIAEENSASSQEVSANVTQYTYKIMDMSSNIKEFKKLTEQFKEDLDTYQI